MTLADIQATLQSTLRQGRIELKTEIRTAVGGGERTVNSQRKLTTGQEKQDTVLAAVQQQEDSRTRKGALEKSQVQHFSSYVHSREHPERANRVLTTGQLEVLPVWYNPS